MDEKKKQEHRNTKTYNLVKFVFLSRKPSGIVLIWLLLKSLKEEKMEWDGWKGKTRTREHKDLQFGQFGVIGEEAIWNRTDLVIVQKPKRKKSWNKTDEKENKHTGTQRLTARSIWCSYRGSRLETCWSGYRLKTWKKKSWNEMDDKEKQEHANTKTYRSVNLVLLARKPPEIVLILLLVNHLK